MLGRNSFTKEEYNDAKAAVAEQLAAYKKIAKLGDLPAGLESVFFSNMALALDRRFVHRVRLVSGKDGNPLNELELICDSIMNNAGVFKGANAIKYVAEQAVLKIGVGDTIKLTARDFERLAAAFFDDLQRKFL